MIGTTLDKYEVLQKVGEGGMATVYLGRHSTLNRDVAIKVLHPHLSSSTRNRKRFAREARAIEHLQHVNILEIFDYSGVDALDCYIITEFVDGQTLSDILRERGKVPSEVAAIMGLHLARALAYAHREGILHRDLKPDNVMVRFDGTLKLMDFGIARFLDESQVTMTGALVGSPAFMSPEQAREQPLDARSDLFSLGTMLFYLVTGHLPFSGSNPSLILKNVIESNRPSVSELSPTMSAGLADLIERLLSTDPEDRHNDAEDVSLALEACLAEANVDCEDSRWNLRRYIEDPDDFDQRLDDHLRQILIVRGKQHLDSGDHLAALRLFNRLLSMDEDNEEVLELVQGLHGEPHRSTRRGTLLALLLILLVIVGGLWGAQQRTPPPPLPQPTTTPTPTTRPVVPLPTSAPLPVPTPQPVVEPVPAPRLSTTVTAPRPIPQAEPPKPEVEPIPQEPGRVRFGDGPLIGTLYIDGTRMGSTREVSRAELELPVGEHVVEVRGDGILDWEQTIIVGSGETMTVPIQLVPRPATLHFRPEHYPGHCQVYLDDNLQGTLVELGYDLLIKRRTESCSVRVSCQGGPEHEKRYNYITDEDYFPPPT